MSKITIDMIEKVYVLGRKLTEEIIEKNDATKELIKLGMNSNSAKMYLTCICGLLSKNKYGRTVNVTATDYFLKNILADYGKDKLETALKILEVHLNEQKGKNNLPSLYKLLNKYNKV